MITNGFSPDLGVRALMGNSPTKDSILDTNPPNTPVKDVSDQPSVEFSPRQRKNTEDKQAFSKKLEQATEAKGDSRTQERVSDRANEREDEKANDRSTERSNERTNDRTVRANSKGTKGLSSKKGIEEKANLKNKMGDGEDVQNQTMTPEAAPTDKVVPVVESESEQSEFAVPEGATPKQAAMLRFMHQMESSVGVRPERVVQAMAELPQDQLTRTPEATMNLVLNDLQLSPKQREKAEVIYQTMLDDTAVAEIKEQNQDTQKMMQVEVLTPQQAKLRDLNTSLDRMNSDFFMRERGGKFAPAGDPRMAQGFESGLEAHARRSQESSQSAASMNSSQDSAASLIGLPQAEFSVPSADPSAIPAEVLSSPMNAMGLPSDVPVDSSTAEAIPANGQPAEAAPKMIPKTPARAKTEKLTPDDFFIKSTPNSTPGQATTLATPPASAIVTPAAAPLAAEIPAETAVAASESAMTALEELTSMLSGGLSTGANADEESLDDDGDFGQQLEMQTPKDKIETSRPEDPTFQMTQATTEKAAPETAKVGPQFTTTTDISRADHIKNMQSIMDRAQVLIQQGGGEAKIQLNPNGLGQVQLHVKVQDGQVNVQMVTESQQAKKAIESGIGELKSDLASHKLNLEMVKVDVGREASNEMRNGQQRQNEQQQDMAREFARNFLGNFREERQSQRDNFFDSPATRGVNNYGKRKIEEPVAGPSNDKPASGSSARRLNRIA